jgi:hypothetical protein
MPGDIEKHRKHLAVVSDDVVRRKLEGFRLKDVTMEPLPFICQPFTVRAPFTEYRKWLHPLDPVTLDDLKNWFGVPNEIAMRMKQERHVIAEDITPIALPQRGFDFTKLDNEQRKAVRQMSKNLLYGYVTPESQSVPAVQAVVRYMLSSAKVGKLQVFVAPYLIVCPDTVVEFHNLPVLYFNNILIYGNGKIKTSSTTTIHAVQIKRVP